MGKEQQLIIDDTYQGSVGIYSPLFNKILKGWEGDNPNTGNRVPIYNHSPLMEHRIFQIRDYYSMEEEEVVFLPEEQAKLLLSKKTIKADDPERESKIDEIHEEVNAHKKEGRKITITEKGDGLDWIIPGSKKTFETLKTAFDIALATKSHVAVTISAHSFDTTLKAYRTRFPKTGGALKL